MCTQTFLPNSPIRRGILLSAFCSTVQFLVWAPKASPVAAAHALGHARHRHSGGDGHGRFALHVIES